jgi:hypothetical protein
VDAGALMLIASRNRVCPDEIRAAALADAVLGIEPAALHRVLVGGSSAASADGISGRRGDLLGVEAANSGDEAHLHSLGGTGDRDRRVYFQCVVVATP